MQEIGTKETSPRGVSNRSHYKRDDHERSHDPDVGWRTGAILPRLARNQECGVVALPYWFRYGVGIPNGEGFAHSPPVFPVTGDARGRG